MPTIQNAIDLKQLYVEVDGKRVALASADISSGIAEVSSGGHVCNITPLGVIQKKKANIAYRKDTSELFKIFKYGAKAEVKLEYSISRRMGLPQSKATTITLFSGYVYEVIGGAALDAYNPRLHFSVVLRHPADIFVNTCTIEPYKLASQNDEQLVKHNIGAELALEDKCYAYADTRGSFNVCKYVAELLDIIANTYKAPTVTGSVPPSLIQDICDVDSAPKLTFPNDIKPIMLCAQLMKNVSEYSLQISPWQTFTTTLSQFWMRPIPSPPGSAKPTKIVADLPCLDIIQHVYRSGDICGYDLHPATRQVGVVKGAFVGYNCSVMGNKDYGSSTTYYGCAGGLNDVGDPVFVEGNCEIVSGYITGLVDNAGVTYETGGMRELQLPAWVWYVGDAENNAKCVSNTPNQRAWAKMIAKSWFASGMYGAGSATIQLPAKTLLIDPKKPWDLVGYNVELHLDSVLGKAPTVYVGWCTGYSIRIAVDVNGITVQCTIQLQGLRTEKEFKAWSVDRSDLGLKILKEDGD